MQFFLCHVIYKTLLFLSNKDNVITELSLYIDNLQQYRDALICEDETRLIQLLDEGRKRKEDVDG